MEYLLQSSSMLIITLIMSVASIQAEAANTSKQRTLKVKAQKQVVVRSSKQFRKLLSSRGGNTQSVDISCKPVSANWCNTIFVSGCEKAGGIGSSDPDGGHVCSFPDAD